MALYCVIFCSSVFFSQNVTHCIILCCVLLGNRIVMKIETKSRIFTLLDTSFTISSGGLSTSHAVLFFASNSFFALLMYIKLDKSYVATNLLVKSKKFSIVIYITDLSPYNACNTSTFTYFIVTVFAVSLLYL